MANLQIETQRLRIQPFCIDDAEDYFRMTRDKSIQKYLPYSYQNSVEEAESTIDEYYAKGNMIQDFYLTIREKSTNAFVGAIFLTQDISSCFHVNRMITPEARGNGYSIEALKGVISILPKKSILLFVIEKDNMASLISLQKLEGIQLVTKQTKGPVAEHLYADRMTFYYIT